MLLDHFTPACLHHIENLRNHITLGIVVPPSPGAEELMRRGTQCEDRGAHTGCRGTQRACLLASRYSRVVEKYAKTLDFAFGQDDAFRAVYHFARSGEHIPHDEAGHVQPLISPFVRLRGRESNQSEFNGNIRPQKMIRRGRVRRKGLDKRIDARHLAGIFYVLVGVAKSELGLIGDPPGQVQSCLAFLFVNWLSSDGETSTGSES